MYNLLNFKDIGHVTFYTQEWLQKTSKHLFIKIDHCRYPTPHYTEPNLRSCVHCLFHTITIGNSDRRPLCMVRIHILHLSVFLFNWHEERPRDDVRGGPIPGINYSHCNARLCWDQSQLPVWQSFPFWFLRYFLQFAHQRQSIRQGYLTLILQYADLNIQISCTPHMTGVQLSSCSPDLTNWFLDYPDLLHIWSYHAVQF